MAVEPVVFKTRKYGNLIDLLIKSPSAQSDTFHKFLHTAPFYRDFKPDVCESNFTVDYTGRQAEAIGNAFPFLPK